VLCGRNGNSYTICAQSDMCMYTHIPHDMGTLARQKKYKTGTPVNAVCQGNPSMCHFERVCCRFASPGMSYLDKFQSSVINSLVISKSVRKAYCWFV